MQQVCYDPPMIFEAEEVKTVLKEDGEKLLTNLNFKEYDKEEKETKKKSGKK